MKPQPARWVTVVESVLAADGAERGAACRRVGSVHAMASGCAWTLCALAVEADAGLKPMPAVEFAVFLDCAPTTTCADCRRAYVRAS